MDVNKDDPIVIYSDDEDDVVLIKEERVAENTDKKQEDDVIFISAKPAPFKIKRKPNKNKVIKDITTLINEETDMDIACSIPHVGYFQSAFSSFSLVDDILRPLGVTHPVVLTSDTNPTVIKHNIPHIDPSHTACCSLTVPDQGEITHGKPGDDIEMSPVKYLHDLDLSPGKNIDNSILTSTSSELERLSPIKCSDAEGGSSKLSQESNTELQKIDMVEDCFSLCLDESNKVTAAGYFTSSTSNLICTGQSSSLNDKQNICTILCGNGVIQKDQSGQSITSSLNNTTYGLDASSPCVNSVAGLASEMRASPSVSGEFMKTISSISCPSLNYTHSVDPSKSQHSESMSVDFPSKTDPNPGKVKQYSSIIDFPALEPDLKAAELRVSKNTSTNKRSSLSFDFNNLISNDLIGLLDLVPAIDISQIQTHPEIGGKGSTESNHTHTKCNGISKLSSSFHRNEILMPKSKESTVTESLLTLTNVSQGNCSAIKSDHQNHTISFSSKGSSVDYVSKMSQKSSTSAMFSPQKDNQLRTSSDQSSSDRSHYLNPLSSIREPCKNQSAYLKYISSIHASVDKVVKDSSRKRNRSNQWIMWANLVQSKKHRLNYYKKYNGLIRKHSNSISHRSASYRSSIKVGKTDASQWQIVSSESTRNKCSAKMSNQSCQFPERKRLNVLEQSVKEKQSLKVKFKRYPPTECPASHSRLPAQDHPYKIGLKKSIIKRQASVIGENSSNSSQPNIGTHCLGSENDQKGTLAENKDVKMCVTCDLNVSNEKHSKCGKGHVICAACLEPQLRAILSGDAKQKYIKCPSSSCFEVVHFDELKRTLPSFVVEILEERLDKEYMSYITKWMFTDEQLKSRSEFATLDTSMTSCPTLSTTKYDQVDNHESRDLAEDLPTFWARMERGAPVMAFEVVPDTDEYRALACQFYETLNFGDYDIVKIIRIQNPILWKYFALKQSEMTQENEGSNVEEKQLYHGTHRSTLEAIARKGFDWRLSGKHGTAYGCGSYFASNARYSHGFTDRVRSGIHAKTGGGSGYMLQASTGLNSLLTGYTPSSLNSRWYLTPPASLAFMNVPSPPPAHGQLSAHNNMPNQAAISASAALTPGTTPNHSSERTQSKAFTSFILPGPHSVKHYQGCFYSSNMFSTPSLYHTQSLSSQTQPSISGFRDYTASPSTSSNKLGPSHAFSNHLYTIDSLGNISCQTNMLGVNNRISHAKGLNENKSANSSTPTISETQEKGSTDLTKTFARDPSSKTNFMFVARVLVGRHTIGKSGMKRPPPLDENNPYGKSYDSCVDHNLYPQIYVIFDSNQAYPEYIIEYNWHKG